MINVMVVSGKFVGQTGKAKFISKDTVVFFPQKRKEKTFLLAEDVTIITSKPEARLTF